MKITIDTNDLNASQLELMKELFMVEFARKADCDVDTSFDYGANATQADVAAVDAIREHEQVREGFSGIVASVDPVTPLVTATPGVTLDSLRERVRLRMNEAFAANPDAADTLCTHLRDKHGVNVKSWNEEQLRETESELMGLIPPAKA